MGSGVASADLGQFMNGLVTPNDDYNVTTFMQGNANRYYRANQLGLFLQDKFQIKPNSDADCRPALRLGRRD